MIERTALHRRATGRRERPRAARSLGIVVMLGVSLLAACGGTADELVRARRSIDTSTVPSGPGPQGPPVTLDSIELPVLPPVSPPPDATFPANEPIVPVVPSADPGTASSDDQATAAVRLSPLVVADPASNGIAAFSVLVPDGWAASGEVQWLPFWSRLAFLQTRVVDPVSGLTIDWLPVQDFMYFTPPPGFDVPIGSNYQGKAYVPPITDPVQFVRDFWMVDSLSHLRDASVVGIEELPAIATDFLTRFGGPGDAGAWRIRYAYDSQGIAWEQDVSFALLWSGTDPVSWYVNFAVTAGAPAGELDRQESLVSSVVASRVTTIEWEANHRLVTQLFYQGIQQQMADTVRFGELLAQYRAESQALQQQVFDERMASIDRRNEIFRETLGGVEGYDDPVNGGVVQLPLGWDTYWVNEQGEYLAVGDPGFDPNTLNDGTWIQLAPRG